MSPTKRLYNIDFLRFMFAIMIMYYHVVGVLNNFHNTSFLQNLAVKGGLIGPNIVYAFFILSGFFLYITNISKPEKLSDFILQKVIRLWPLMAISFVPFIFLGTYNKYLDTLNIFFISAGTGIVKGGSNNPATWFICVLFFTSIFFYCLIKQNSRQKIINICAFFSFFCFIILTYSPNGKGYGAIALPALRLTVGMIEALGGMSLGILCAIIYSSFSLDNEKTWLGKKILISVAEIFIFLYFIKSVAWHNPQFSEEIYYQLLFIILLFLFLQNKGFFSQLFNHKIFGVLGSFSYAIYVMHFPCIAVLRKYILETNLIKNDAHLLLLFTTFCIVVGGGTAICVERPITNYLKGKLRKNKQSKKINARNL